MESMLEGTVNYLQFVASTLDAAKQTEEPQDRPPKQHEEAIKMRNKPPKVTNSTSTDVTSGGAWYNRMTAKPQGCHSITPVINK